MKNKNKLWFSILSKDARYPPKADKSFPKADEPEFFPPELFVWTKNSNQIADDIKNELLQYLQNNNLQSYFNTKMSDDVKKWKTISLKWWGLEFYQNQKHFPKTTRFINSIPGLVSASFNLLEPHSKIFPHCGDTNGIYRCHLGLIIPGHLPDCGFRVENKQSSWEEGKWLIFIDAKEHEAWNNTDRNRFILLIDIVRPEFSKHHTFIVLCSLTGLFLQKCAEAVPFLYKLQNKLLLKKTIVYLLLPFCYLASKARNVMSRWGLVS